MGTSEPLRIATRGSQQATTQALAVADRLISAGFAAELVIIDTQGDRTQSANLALHSIGGQGVFTKEVQLAVLDGRADVAVHSAKDLPTAPAEGLVIAAFTERRSAADALVGLRLSELAFEATIATGSVRRRAQLRRARPDLVFQELRGNIGTRLEKVPADGSIVMAVAALEVLDLTDRIAEVLDPAEFVPAVGQGCVAVECRHKDRKVLEALGSIDHRETRYQVTIERAFMAELGSGCSLPIGAHVHGSRLYIFLADPDTGRTASDTIELSGGLDEDVAHAANAAAAAHAHVTNL